MNSLQARSNEIDSYLRRSIGFKADSIMTFCWSKTIARRHGLHATFMPKPKSGINGSGMHILICLEKTASHIYDSKDPD